MSKRGLVPLFLAIGLGVGNGIWVFSPAFKERNEEKEEMQKALETARQSESGALNLRDAEAAASRATATKAALKGDTPRSWWPSLWSTETNTGVGKPQDKLPTKDDATKKDNW